MSVQNVPLCVHIFVSFGLFFFSLLQRVLMVPEASATFEVATVDAILLLLLKQLYNICRGPGFVLEILRPQPGVLQMS